MPRRASSRHSGTDVNRDPERGMPGHSPLNHLADMETFVEVWPGIWRWAAIHGTAHAGRPGQGPGKAQDQPSVRQSAHEATRLLVADAQVGRLQTRPACLTLRQWQALGLADELADPRAWRKRCGCTGAASPAGPYFEARSASTRTSARSEASLTMTQACPRRSARREPSRPRLRSSVRVRLAPVHAPVSYTNTLVSDSAQRSCPAG
jgi:hypothetical protein